MSTITPWKDGNKEAIKIETKGINEIRNTYLKELNLTSIEEASLETANKLFIAVINDFKTGKLSIDELSSFGSEIFHGLAKKYKKSDLFQASLSASELSFAIRSEVTYSNISSYLSDLDTFYQKINKIGVT